MLKVTLLAAAKIISKWQLWTSTLSELQYEECTVIHTLASLLVCLNYVAWIVCGLQFVFVFLHSFFILQNLCCVDLHLLYVFFFVKIVLCNPLWIKWFYTDSCWGFRIKVLIWASSFFLCWTVSEVFIGEIDLGLQIPLFRLGSQNKDVDLDRTIKKLRSPNLDGSGHFFSSSCSPNCLSEIMTYGDVFNLLFAYLFCFVFHLSFCIIYMFLFFFWNFIIFVDLLYFVFLYELSNFTLAVRVYE